ncbi:endolytic transglycosylase MltG [Putridiphycobacter roseus]|uniref:Endolytic murein transglycosylase n=1 Tax=Putridiphycobacter roseus TaxID=2219161 RepID=A0A2W1MZI7_9FLAO|nr:endolytic transglycosylase MltG [Putridiphycobacter roseus]PZE17639.1 endolytic transglycosylase MltG [Putridiphycobacter roseus]
MKKIIVVLLLSALIAIAFIFYPKYHKHFSKIKLDTAEDVIVFVPSKSNLALVGQTLVDKHLFASNAEFKEYANEFGLNDANIEAGKYSFHNGQKLKHVIYAIKNGNQELKNVKIAFTYSQNIPSMISKIAGSIEADSATLVNYILSPAVLEKYGFKEETIISLFLPDTYEIGEWDVSPEEFVAFMATKYKEFWNVERLAKAKSLNLSQSQVATLASIVMSEQSKLENEWPIIAGLYLNRLERGIKLESDPTFKFCWGDELNGVQRLLFKHRDRDCPYNTYIYAGLPPGPILLVSKKAIDAVLNYEKHNYIFMCAVGDGTSEHNFASTYGQHLKNAAIYRRNQFGK